jgi:hypothetical protein
MILMLLNLFPVCADAVILEKYLYTKTVGEKRSLVEGRVITGSELMTGCS